MKRIIERVFLGSLLAALAGLGCARRPPADLILRGARIHTMNPSQPEADAVVVRGERIVFVGSELEAMKFTGATTQVMDLSGATVLPGLMDAHGHLLSLGRSLSELNLTGTTSAAEIHRMVLENAATAPTGAWISGRGWDQNDWRDKAFPTWRDLEGAEDHPVYLRRVDGHAAWLNRTGMAACGINASTPDPQGGRILRDADGEPTGVLLDNALELVVRAMPKPNREELLQWAQAAIRECHRLGLTGVHDAGAGSAALEVYQELRDRGELTLRVYAMLDDSDPAFLEEWLARGPQVDPFLTVRSVKLYADGALGSRGAALLEAYSDDPGNRGLLIHADDYLQRVAEKAGRSGFQVCTHAIGDAGNRAALDAYQAALNSFPTQDHRWRIEHCQVIAPDDFSRFAQSGIIASMQPTHATSDMYWAADRLGIERVGGAYAWRTLLQAGTRLALGSDFPVESPDPLKGILAAVTRQDEKGLPNGGWHPEQRLSVIEALRGFTLDAAYAAFAEGERGSIESGKLADFTVLTGGIDLQERDPAAQAQQWGKTRVKCTIVGGKIVWRAAE